MKLIPVEAVPKRRGRHHLQDLIEEFVRGDDKVVQRERHPHHEHGHHRLYHHHQG